MTASNQTYTGSPIAYRVTWQFMNSTHVNYWCGACYATRSMPGPTALAELHEGPCVPPAGALCSGCLKPWEVVQS